MRKVSFPLLLQTICTGLLLWSLPVSAEWTEYVHEADPMLNEGGYTTYTYYSGGDRFLIFSSQPDQYSLMTQDVFDTEVSSGYVGCVVKVGLYEGESLTEQFTMWLDLDRGSAHHRLNTRNAGAMSNPVGQGKKVKKIISHLRKPDCSVRIIAPKYGNKSFDIRIPSRTKSDQPNQ